MTDTAETSEDLSCHSEEACISCVTCKALCKDVEVFNCSCLTDTNVTHEIVYCDVCINSHTRQKHDVIDSKGYKPAVCVAHSVVCSLFCQDCQVVFCLKCLDNHYQHKSEPISQKATEVRKSVFKYLGEFDTLSKPLAERKAFVDDSYKHRNELYPQLSADNFVDMLTTFFANSLRNNESKWKELILSLDSFEQVNAIHDRADSDICSLRSMLTMSDGDCISSFLDSQTNLELSIAEQKTEIQKPNSFKCCASLDEIVDGCIKKSIELWKIPHVQLKYYDSLKFKQYDEYDGFWRWDSTYLDRILYGLSISSTQLSFFSFNYFGGFIQHTRSNLKPEFSVRSVFKCEDKVALLSNDNTIRIQGIKDNFMDEKPLQEPITLDVGLKLLSFSYCPYPFNYSTFICWNSKELSIQSRTNDTIDWEIPGCLMKPKLFAMNDFNAAFLDDTNKLTIFNLDTKLIIEALPVHHGMYSIDNVSLVDHDKAFLFDYQAKTVAEIDICLSSTVNSKWEVKKIFKCTADHYINSRGTQEFEYRYMFAGGWKIIALDFSDRMLDADYRKPF